MTDSNDLQPVKPPAGPPRAMRVRVGIGLILLSGVFWFSLLAVPFLPLTVGQKSALGAGLFIGVQGAWWVGAAIAGPVAIQRLLRIFRRRPHGEPADVHPPDQPDAQ